MDIFEEYLIKIENPANQVKMRELLVWTQTTFPTLHYRIGWNQPMFTNDETYIIGYSYSKQHIAISPETYTLEKFQDKLKNAGYSTTKMIFRIKWDEDIDYSLLKEMIEFNLIDKQG